MKKTTYCITSFILFALFIALPLVTHAAESFVAQTVGGTNSEVAYAITQTTDGGYAIAGETISFGEGYYDFYVAKFTSNGDLDANFGVGGTRTIGGNSSEQAYAIEQTTDGGYIIAGETRSFGVGLRDMYIVKLTNAGNLDGSFGSGGTLTIGGTSDDYAYDITQTTDGGYIVAGYTESFGVGNRDMYIVKLTSTGNLDGSFGENGTRTIGGAFHDYAYAIEQTTDGGYIVAGSTNSFGGNGEVYVVKLKNDGDFDESFGSGGTRTVGGGGADVANAIIQNTDGDYVLVGTTGTSTFGSLDMYVVKLTNAGNLDTSFGSNGTRNVGGSGTEYGNSIIQTTDGDYVIAGYTASFGSGSSDMYIAKLTSDGNLDGSFGSSGTRTIGGSGGETVYGIIQSTDGGYIIAGNTGSFGAGASDVYIAKITSSGELTGCSHANATGGSIGDGGGNMNSGGILGTSAPTLLSGGGIGSGGTLTQQCTITVLQSPVLTTSSTTDITPTTATGNGSITDTGGEDPERFIEWGTTSGTYTNSCSAGTGTTGSYSCAMTLLTPGMTYYVRAKATNSAGTSYGSETSFQTLGDTTLIEPTTTDIQNTVTEGYITVDNGTVDNTTQTTTQVNVTLQTANAQAIFPANTTITEASSGNFNFENFTISDATFSVENSIAAISLGIPGTNLSFSQNITVTLTPGIDYNGQEFTVYSQSAGESTWTQQATCTVTDGDCVFTTNHATIYTINGTPSSTGDTPLNINTEVLDTLTMDCYESTNGSGTYDVLLGTVSNPGYVTAGTPAIGQSTCTVTTNDDQGYYLTVEDDNGISSTVLTHTDPNTGTLYEIQDLTHWNDTTLTTENWNPPTTKGLGFSIITFPDTDTSNNIFDGIWTETGNCPEGINPDSNDYAGFPDTPQTIAAVPQYTANHTTTNICYKVDVPASQPSGTYTGSVTYTATSDASSYLN
jgi:uncharacterized delta-60 repeat protein